MAEIRLYRQMYRIENANLNSGSTYNLVDVASLSASTFDINGSTGSTIVEYNLTPTRESQGVYYVDLNPQMYSFDVTYELKWYVNYVDNSPQRILPTRFKIEPQIVGNVIQVQIESSNNVVRI